jgi:hypothetical protein
MTAKPANSSEFMDIEPDHYTIGPAAVEAATLPGLQQFRLYKSMVNPMENRPNMNSYFRNNDMFIQHRTEDHIYGSFMLFLLLKDHKTLPLILPSQAGSLYCTKKKKSSKYVAAVKWKAINRNILMENVSQRLA